jgi:effector-binding domain-containing protein
MKGLRIILVIFLFIIILPLIVSLFLPSEKFIEEHIEINAKADVVFDLVNKLPNWEKWSPFKEDDPEMTSEYIGESGIGSSHIWKSKKMGDGYLEIVESINNERVVALLNFLDDSTSSSITTFALYETDTITIVKWSIEIEKLSYPFGRIMGLFMEKMMRNSFKKGLKNLKKASTNHKVDLYRYHISQEILNGFKAYTITDSSKMDELKYTHHEKFQTLYKFIDKHKINTFDYPFTIYHQWNPDGYTIFEIGIIVNELKTIQNNMRVTAKEFPENIVIKLIHNGSYESSANAHLDIYKYIKNNQLNIKGWCMEKYLIGPFTESDTVKWETIIMYPLQ